MTRVSINLQGRYLGIPWTEIDYLMAFNTSVLLYKQIKEGFPELVALNQCTCTDML